MSDQHSKTLSENAAANRRSSRSDGSAWLDSPTEDGFWWYLGSRANDWTIYEVRTEEALTAPGDKLIITFRSGDWYLSKFQKAFPGGRWQRVAPPNS